MPTRCICQNCRFRDVLSLAFESLANGANFPRRMMALSILQCFYVEDALQPSGKSRSFNIFSFYGNLGLPCQVGAPPKCKILLIRGTTRVRSNRRNLRRSRDPIDLGDFIDLVLGLFLDQLSLTSTITHERYAALVACLDDSFQLCQITALNILRHLTVNKDFVSFCHRFLAPIALN